MDVLERICHNIMNWKPKDLVICMGYTMEEVLPAQGAQVHASQARVLEYLKQCTSNSILLQDAFEVDLYLDSLGSPKSAEVIGSCYNQCVFNAVIHLLERKVPVKINPALTLCRLEIIGCMQEDIEGKGNWIEKNIKKLGFNTERNKEYLICR